jgi:sialic acid synthase SpsE
MNEYFTLSCGREIGNNKECFIVAEIGNNHQGRFDLAAVMIEEAAKAGADAVKFQKRDIPSLLTSYMYNQPYKSPDSFGPTYGKHREALELSIEDFSRLKEIAEQKGLIFFSSVWDEKSLHEVNSLGVEIIKICSADLVNIPLLRKAASLSKIIFLSTGMSTIEEIDVAVEEISSLNDKLILLHCNSSYPCDEEQIALPVISFLSKRYKVPVGYSGHEVSIAPSVAAVALGACVVERHFTLDKSLCGTDHKVSLTPLEFKELVKGIREVERAIKVKEKRVFDEEKKVALKLRKSIVAKRDLRKGTILTEEDITVKSPGTGISPIYWDKIIGRELKQDIQKDELLTWKHVEKLEFLKGLYN